MLIYFKGVSVLHHINKFFNDIHYSFLCIQFQKQQKLRKIYIKTSALESFLINCRLDETPTHRCFPVNIIKFLRTTFLQKYLRESASAFLFKLLLINILIFFRIFGLAQRNVFSFTISCTESLLLFVFHNISLVRILVGL